MIWYLFWDVNYCRDRILNLYRERTRGNYQTWNEDKKSLSCILFVVRLLSFFSLSMSSKSHLKSAWKPCCGCWQAWSFECKTSSIRQQIWVLEPRSSSCSDWPQNWFLLQMLAFFLPLNWFCLEFSLYRHRAWTCWSCFNDGSFRVGLRLRWCRTLDRQKWRHLWDRGWFGGWWEGWLPCDWRVCIIFWLSTSWFGLNVSRSLNLYYKCSSIKRW